MTIRARMSIFTTVFISITLLVSKGPMASAVSAIDSVTFAFVVDTTTSMAEELHSVRDGVKRIIDEDLREIESYIVVQFNDPDVERPFKSSDETAVKQCLDGILLHSRRNYDCPEMAMAGLLEAIRVSKPNSFIFFFTDASAKDYIRYKEVITAANAKGLKIYMMLTGCCGTCSQDDHFDVYEKIEKNTGSKLYRTKKSDVKTFMNYLHTVSTTDFKKLRTPPKTIEEVEEIAERGIQSTAKPTTETTITTRDSILTPISKQGIRTAVIRCEAPRLSLSNCSLMFLAVTTSLVVWF